MFYVYGLYCICEKCETRGSTQIRYVGFTSRPVKKRYREHLNDRARTPKSSWIQAHGGEGIRYEILSETETLAEAIEQETHFISALDTYLPDSLSGGLNLTLGGDGVVGRIASDAERIRTSEVSAARWQQMDEYSRTEHCEKISAGNKRSWRDMTDDEYAERCQSMSDGRKRARELRSDEATARLVAERRQRTKEWWDNLTVEDRAAQVRKISESNKSRVFTDEERAIARERGKLTSHTRWHTNRGISNPNCALCNPS